MKQLKLISILSLCALLLFCAACKTVSTTILNTESKIYYGGSQIETTVRELSVDGGKTTARIRFRNLGSEALDSLEALVEFVDEQGNTIATDVISETYTDAIEVGSSVSETAECKSDDRIVGVYVTEYTP